MTNYYFNDNEILALYKGENLLYERIADDGSGYGINHLVGEFTGKLKPVIAINGSNVTIETDNKGFFDIEIKDKLTTCDSMFSAKSTLKSVYHLPPTGDVTEMKYMFSGCSALETVDFSRFNTKNVTNMQSMFSRCTSLVTLDISSFDMSNVNTMVSMFDRCSKLQTLIFGNFDISTAEAAGKTYSMYYDCSALKNVSGNITGIKNSFSLGDSPLTNASAMVFINGLAEVSATKRITFKATTYNTLTEDQIAIATSRGWSVASA